MRAHLIRLVAVAVAFLLASTLFKHNFTIASNPNVTRHWLQYLIDAFAFAVLNVTVGAVLRIFTLPLRILTFGLFSIVINAVLILILSVLPAATYVRLHTNVVGAFEAAILISLVSALAEIVAIRDHDKKKKAKA